MKNPFGTDGLRGKVGRYPMTPDFVMKLGWAIGRAFTTPDSNMVVIGKDTRLSGYMFESALEAGLSAAGASVLLLGPLPTPGVSFVTKKEKAIMGIVITASHNPYDDNGIKLFRGDGRKLSHESEALITEWLEKPIQTVASNSLGRAWREDRAADMYVDYCLEVAGKLDLSGMKLVLDCANGSAYSVAPRVYQRLGCELTVIGGHPDGLNINRKVGSMHPQQLQRVVCAQEADMGLAVDGDGDRLLMVDDRGELVEGDELLAIIACHRQETVGLDGVVGTEMSSVGLERSMAERGVAFERAAVGDRNVSQLMDKLGWNLGGESSGHIICFDKVDTGDAIVASLELMKALRDRKAKLSELKKVMKKLPQVMVNIPLNGTFDVGNELLQSLISEARGSLGDTGRVLVRKSGTEPLLRVLVEAELSTDCDYWCKRITDCINGASQSVKFG